ncbi:MFS general substrate transporter [Gymnopus androsaceus JB14]|uniref:MFS general substrate transporter n=1 Tax=Gymnopus androsaceus JB14 TaxID=1447944 RepID=A0A6A4GN31_9AGAR|nr:MFS general substrate transporter [Gymnopus androsaceus JB14]
MKPLITRKKTDETVVTVVNAVLSVVNGESNTSRDSEKTTASTFEDVPEGGFAGWATVLGAFLIQFCGFGYTASFGVFQDFYTQVYITNESSSAISWIGGINAFMTITGGVVAGKFFDKGYFYHLMIGGAILESFCLFMLSLTKPNQFYQVFLSQGVGAGLGAGMMYVPSMAVVSHYFRKRRALAMTIVASGSSLGSIIHPIMLNNLLGPLGFAKAARANAGLVSGLLLIACASMRTRLPPSPAPIGFREALVKFSKDRAYVCATAGMMIFSIGYYYPLFYIQLDASLHGINPSLVFYSLVILNGSSIVGRLTPGFVAHRFGVANMLTFGMVGCSAVIFGMIGLGRGEAGYVVVAILYGYCAGTYISLISPLFSSFAHNQAEIGARIGIGFAFSGVSALIGGPIDGALATSEFIWWRPALFSGLVTFIGFCFMVVMIQILRRRSSQKIEEKA